MTFGIDIAGFQAGIDLALAKTEGVEFVIVKASGFNTGTLYVADEYHEHIDAAVAAGLPKGHYYLIGGGQVWKTPTEQARWFVSKLYRFDIARDVLMLDNEGLNSNGYLFDDDEAAEFMTEVIRLTGIDSRQVWHYAGANDYRNLKPWPKIEALGIRYVWAAYGDRPSGQTPDHEPSLQGSIPRWDVHQFTSNARVAGRDVDGDYSRATVDELFGGAMAYFQSRPARGRITHPFGAGAATPTSPASHLGQDYGWGGGDEIFAARGGIVRSYGRAGAYGNRLVVEHGQGRQTWYCHIREGGNVVSVGDEVGPGEHIAWMGDTGNVTAKHLHFEFRIDGVAVNPEPYFGGITTAGVDRDAIDNTTTRPLLPWEAYERETEMLFMIKMFDGDNRFGGGWFWAVCGVDYFVEVRTEDAANVLAKRFGEAANVTYAEWDAFKAAAGVTAS